jgi:hypothetical protein
MQNWCEAHHVFSRASRILAPPHRASRSFVASSDDGYGNGQGIWTPPGSQSRHRCSQGAGRPYQEGVGAGRRHGGGGWWCGMAAGGAGLRSRSPAGGGRWATGSLITSFVKKNGASELHGSSYCSFSRSYALFVVTFAPLISWRKLATQVWKIYRGVMKADVKVTSLTNWTSVCMNQAKLHWRAYLLVDSVTCTFQTTMKQTKKSICVYCDCGAVKHGILRTRWLTSSLPKWFNRAGCWRPNKVSSVV